MCFVDYPLFHVTLNMMVLLQLRPQNVEGPACYNWLTDCEKLKKKTGLTLLKIPWKLINYLRRWTELSMHKNTYLTDMFSCLKNPQDKSKESKF